MSSKSSLRQNWFPVRIALPVWAALVVLAYPAFFPQLMIAQEGMRARSQDGELECVSYCSTRRPGVVMMEVKVRLSDHSLSEMDLRAKVRQQGLDITVYSEGFERGLYATVSAIKPKAVFRAPTKGDTRAPAVQTQSKIPGLENLVITDVATRLDKSAESLRLLQPNIRATTEGEWVILHLEGLEPGMAYTYRVPGGTSVVTRQAVVCPVDRIHAPANRTRRKPKTTR